MDMRIRSTDNIIHIEANGMIVQFPALGRDFTVEIGYSARDKHDGECWSNYLSCQVDIAMDGRLLRVGDDEDGCCVAMAEWNKHSGWGCTLRFERDWELLQLAIL